MPRPSPAKPPARRSSAGPRRGRASPWWFALRHLVLWSALALAAYWLWLDREVVTAFENRRWDLPARVFGRPLELFPAAPLSAARLVAELELLGYAPVTRVRGPGQFLAQGDVVEFHSRGYAFWDEPERARHLRAEFGRNELARLSELPSGAAVDLTRLEPSEIGRLNPRHFEDRLLVSIDEVPQGFVDALVAVEDRRFFRHHGVDVLGLLRATLVNLRAGRVVQGGSTLTQQLVKNLYLSQERTFARKFNEMMMALSLERRYGKGEILETYLNEVFLGQDGDRAIHGFELASRFYFARPIAELDAGRMALLIGLVKGPSAFNPRRNPERARERRDVVLGLMAEAGVIGVDEAAAARASPLGLKAGARVGKRDFPAFMALVRRQLLAEYDAGDLDAAGLNIHTTLDVVVQRAAEKAVREQLPEIEQRHRQRDLQAAMVVVAPANGEILAIVSDRNPDYSGFNRAVDARRPIGSLVKPFVYAAALDQPERFSLLTQLDDYALTWTAPNGRTWRPKNYDGREHGTVTVLDALTRSLNLATVDLGLRMGLDAVADYLQRLGLGNELKPYPSLLLGAVERAPLELAELYATIANDGFRVPLRAISAVTDQRQRKLNRYALDIEPVMQPATAALVRYALTEVVANGTARAVRGSLPALQPLAGKTGTSNDSRDSWFAGFGDNLLGVAWVGRDDNAATGLTGSSGALRIWAATMPAAGVVPLGVRVPNGIEWLVVDPVTGGVLGAGCPGGKQVPVHRASPRLLAPPCAGLPLPAPASPLQEMRPWSR